MTANDKYEGILCLANPPRLKTNGLEWAYLSKKTR